MTVPTQSEALVSEDFRATSHWYRALYQLASDVANLKKWTRSFLIEAPANGDYRVMVNVPVGIKITSVTTVCASGTATLTAKINTTALGGTANSVSSTEQTQDHAADNVMAVGDDLVFTFASVSSAVKVTATLSGMLRF